MMGKLRRFIRFNLLGAGLWALTLTMAAAYSDPPVNAIPYKKAKRIALKARPGKIKDFQQRQRKEEWVYSFKILCADQVVREVDVDVVTGKIVYGAKRHPPSH
jgi:uncharacterized membrane protein YkoI